MRVRHSHEDARVPLFRLIATQNTETCQMSAFVLPLWVKGTGFYYIDEVPDNLFYAKISTVN